MLYMAYVHSVHICSRYLEHSSESDNKMLYISHQCYSVALSNISKLVPCPEVRVENILIVVVVLYTDNNFASMISS